jgi:3-deoxy-7-phosphoheptulonate synthase
MTTRQTPHPLVGGADPHARSLVRVGERFVGAGTFTLIAGPCAVESADQLAAACEAAVAAGATMLRGDLFKHRTSPYSFQGLGRDGMALVAEQRARFGLPWVAEVLDVGQLEQCADVIDVVRVGARNMQNFDLLRACAQSGKPVMLKRGLSATVEEWLLAAEYVAHSGNLDIILCERGIRTFEPSTRNTLDLSAVVVAQERSHLPVIVDPSHGTGSRALVAPMALAAVAAGADGIMVDVHADPPTARCDGPQALLPDEVVALGARLRDLAAWTGRRTEPEVGAEEVVTEEV